jgi:hypothetical protein
MSNSTPSSSNNTPEVKHMAAAAAAAVVVAPLGLPITVAVLVAYGVRSLLEDLFE